MPNSNEHVVKLAAKVGAEAALKAFSDQMEKVKSERVDRRLRNAKLLLRNYRAFKAHAENALYDARDLDEDAYDIIDLMSDNWKDSDLFVDSIRQSAARTCTIVRHIDTMLGLYRAFCENAENTEEMRRWDVINGRYISEEQKSIKEIADKYGVTERTIYRDEDIAIERIAALIFGIDGIRKG